MLLDNVYRLAVEVQINICGIPFLTAEPFCVSKLYVLVYLGVSIKQSHVSHIQIRQHVTFHTNNDMDLLTATCNFNLNSSAS